MSLRSVCISAGLVFVMMVAALVPAAAAPTYVGEFPYARPFGLATFHDGRIVVTDIVNSRVTVFTPEGTVLAQFGQPGSGNGEFSFPYYSAVSADQSGIYVSDTANNRIQVFTADGTFLSKFGSPGAGLDQFFGPFGIGVMPDGRMAIADAGNARVVVYSIPGVPSLAIAPPGLLQPGALGVTPDGRLYVADQPLSQVLIAGIDGAPLGGLNTAGPGNLLGIDGIGLSPDGRVFASSTVTHEVKIFTASGEFIETFGGLGNGPGQFQGPKGIAVLPNGRVFVADATNERVTIWQDPAAVVLPKTLGNGKRVIRTRKRSVKLTGRSEVGIGTGIAKVTAKAGKRSLRPIVQPGGTWQVKVPLRRAKRVRVVVTTEDLLGQVSTPLARVVRRKR